MKKFLDECYRWFLRLAGTTFMAWFMGMYVLGRYFPELTTYTPHGAGFMAAAFLTNYMLTSMYLMEMICRTYRRHEQGASDASDLQFLARCLEFAVGYMPIAGFFVRQVLLKKVPQIRYKYA